jgi:signal transduction histidine kinase
VRDWGCGFLPSAVPAGNAFGEHIGLREMQERLALIGGHLRVRSRRGAGTVVVAEVPLLTAEERGAADER